MNYFGLLNEKNAENNLPLHYFNNSLHISISLKVLNDLCQESKRKLNAQDLST